MHEGLLQQHDAVSRLARIDLLAGLPAEALQRLERRTVFIELRDGTDVFVQGVMADAAYAIIGGEGSIRIGAADSRGKRLMVEVLRTGSMFGEVALLDGGVRSATATVDGRVRLAKFPASAFMAALDECPSLGAAIARSLAQRLRRTFALFQDATFETLETRLARQLLHLGDLHGRPTGKGVMLSERLKQPDLADLLGATPRSIITILNAWREQGLVIYDTIGARLTITDTERMRALVRAAQ